MQARAATGAQVVFGRDSRPTKKQLSRPSSWPAKYSRQRVLPSFRSGVCELDVKSSPWSQRPRHLKHIVSRSAATVSASSSQCVGWARFSCPRRYTRPAVWNDLPPLLDKRQLGILRWLSGAEAYIVSRYDCLPSRPSFRCAAIANTIWTYDMDLQLHGPHQTLQNISAQWMYMPQCNPRLYIRATILTPCDATLH